LLSPFASIGSSAIHDARYRLTKAQSYLLSIRPYLTPRPSKSETAERGPVEEGKESKSLVSSTEQDEVFHWGRQVDVNWRMVAYVTFRDQVSPEFSLVQSNR
jgi:hypothetical protein